MRFDCDDDELVLTWELEEGEAPEIDLRTGIGGQILTELETSLRLCWAAGVDPWGRPWPPLSRATVAEKGHTLVGYETGAMLLQWGQGGTPGRVITERSAAWFYPHEGRHSKSWGKAHGFHNGRKPHQPARPLFGWPPHVERLAQELIAAAQSLAVAETARPSTSAGPWQSPVTVTTTPFTSSPSPL
jgi:hypothetical protein